MSPLARAAYTNNLDSLKFLHGKGARMYIREYQLGLNVLMIATYQHHNAIVEWLLSIDYDVKRHSDEGDTALDIAIKSENGRAVDLLCDHIKRKHGISGRTAPAQ